MRRGTLNKLRQLTFSLPSRDFSEEPLATASLSKSGSIMRTKTIMDCKQRKRPICEISAMQLEARRMKRRASNFQNNWQDYQTEGTDAEVPLSKSQIRENLIVRWNVNILVATIFIQTIAIFWNMFALWSYEKPDVWNNNWETNTSKGLITATCVVLAVIVIWLRLIDLRQLPKEYPRKRSYLFIACECAFIMVHIPPYSQKLGCKVDYDLWNIMGTAKFYLLLELCKISHPLWLRRYEAASARLQSRKEPDMIGTFFCATGTLSQFDPLDVFVLTLLIALGMFTMWIYFMERTRIDFNLLDTVDYVLSSFFTVPTADQQVLRTLTGRTIKIFTGLFSMCYGAIIGWTFGFRVAENTQTMTDLLEDVNAYINHRQRQAKKIQTWWRRIKGKPRAEVPVKDNNRLRWSTVMSSVRKEKIRSLMSYSAKQTMELVTIREKLEKIEEANGKLVEENEKLSRENGKLLFTNNQLEQLLIKCAQPKSEP